MGYYFWEYQTPTANWPANWICHHANNKKKYVDSNWIIYLNQIKKKGQWLQLTRTWNFISWMLPPVNEVESDWDNRRADKIIWPCRKRCNCIATIAFKAIKIQRLNVFLTRHWFQLKFDWMCVCIHFAILWCGQREKSHRTPRLEFKVGRQFEFKSMDGRYIKIGVTTLPIHYRERERG